MRAGTKLIVTTGLVAMAAFYAWVAVTTSATTGYGVIAAQMVVFGAGLGLTSAPATESIMGAIPRSKAGVGSAVNDTSRLVGGTLGVAVIGSVYASVYGSRLSATRRARPGRSPAYVAAGRSRCLRPPGARMQHASAKRLQHHHRLLAGWRRRRRSRCCPVPARPARPANPGRPARPPGGR